MANAKKIELVDSLREKIRKAKSIVFADYKGLKANDFNELRQQIKKNKGEVAIAKNTLLKRALEAEGHDISILKGDLKGLTATMFGYEDPVSPIKAIFEFVKRIELPKVKGAIFEGIYNDASKVEAISNLPSKEVLIARMLGGMMSPVSGFANVLSGTKRKVVIAFNEIAKKKS